MASSLDIGGTSAPTTGQRDAFPGLGPSPAERPGGETLEGLLLELAATARAGVQRAQGLMRARELEEMLRRSADVAIDEASGPCTEDGAIDRAVSSVRAADAARHEGTRALALWIEHLERVDRLSRAAERALIRAD